MANPGRPRITPKLPPLRLRRGAEPPGHEILAPRYGGNPSNDCVGAVTGGPPGIGILKCETAMITNNSCNETAHTIKITSRRDIAMLLLSAMRRVPRKHCKSSQRWIREDSWV